MFLISVKYDLSLTYSPISTRGGQGSGSLASETAEENFFSSPGFELASHKSINGLTTLVTIKNNNIH